MQGRLPTLSDVARRAGVSYATVDRVVNDRGGVADKSVKRVREAIDELGYVRNVAAANLSQSRTYRFAAIIPTGTNQFFQQLRAILEAERIRLLADRINLRIEGIAAFDGQALCECLDMLARTGIDGVALVGTDDDIVARKIAELRAAGIAVLTLVSDAPNAPRDAYFGIDNRVAGQTAGRLIGLCHGGSGGRVLPIVGALSAPDHAERLEGMRETVTALYPDLAIAPVIIGRDEHEIVESKLRPIFENSHDITAVYSVGGGNAGLLRVLRALPADQNRPIVVLHDIVPQSREALESGVIDAIIDQRPEVEIANALNCLRSIADRRPPDVADPILPAVYFKENLPPPQGRETDAHPADAPSSDGARPASKSRFLKEIDQ